MARNGSGTFSPSVDFTTEAGSPPIEISKLDTAIDDLGDEITNSIAADGQTQPSANLPMNGFKHTNVANAAARNQYATAADVQDQDLVYFVDSGSADTYVITPSPAITAYEEGQRFVFRATNTNTGASTLNVNSLGATAIETNDGNALEAGVIVAGGYYEVVFDANSAPDRFVLMSPSSIALGDLASQDNINNSDWSGTDLAVANGGTGASDASGARSNLGLGSLATQSSVNNGDWSGTDLAVGNGGTGASNASGARTNLGIGSIATRDYTASTSSPSGGSDGDVWDQYV